MLVIRFFDLCKRNFPAPVVLFQGDFLCRSFEQFTDKGVEQVYGEAAGKTGEAGPWLEKGVETKANKIDRMLKRNLLGTFRQNSSQLVSPLEQGFRVWRQEI